MCIKSINRTFYDLADSINFWNYVNLYQFGSQMYWIYAFLLHDFYMFFDPCHTPFSSPAIIYFSKYIMLKQCRVSLNPWMKNWTNKTAEFKVIWDFLGHSVVRIQYLHCHGSRFNPQSGNKGLKSHVAVTAKNNNTLYKVTSTDVTIHF